MSSATTPHHEPNPATIFDTLNAYQRSAALKAAIELDVFTEVARGGRSAEALARGLNAPLRGVRILADYLVIIGFLSKQGDDYFLTPDSAMFLDRNSPAYLGGTVEFMHNPVLTRPYEDLAQVVRSGRTTLPDEGTVSHDNPIWVTFAKQMAPMVYPAALEMAALVAGDGGLTVLDIAAGHGLFGLTIAQRNPGAHITALDWPNVLTVAAENANKFGVSDRFSKLEGSAFDVDFGGPYDLVLVTNFFHHFDQDTCETLIRKIRNSLGEGGKCVTLDFIPNEDRVSPPTAAAFAMMMLGSTPAGDAFTFAEYEGMFRNSGFTSSRLHALTRAPQSVVISAT